MKIMSAANYMLTEEQLLCCICLDVFTDPATLPCGHNFCKSCITQHLNFNSQRQCPMCKEHVDRKYKLGVNTFISEMVVQFRRSAVKKACNGSEPCVATPEKDTYNVPAGCKRKSARFRLLLAVSLTCLLVFFATNLYFHLILSSLKNNLLLDSVAENMCTKHVQLLDLYCRREYTPICKSCRGEKHRFHPVVPLKDEYEAQRSELLKTKAEINRMTQERWQQIQELKQSVELSEEAAGREMADGVQFFTALIQSLEGAQADLAEMIEEKQKTTENQPKQYIEDMEREISELMRRRAEAEQLSQSKNQLHFLRSFASLKAALPTKDWSQVSVCPVTYEGVMRSVLVKAVNLLTETIRKQMKKLEDVEMKNMKRFAAEVTLDPDTAHPALVLSDDGKRVHCGDVRKKLPDHSKRFEPAMNVLGKQSFSCGRFHYDVQVKGKTGWTLGVARESVSRKGDVKLNPENGFWTIRLRNSTEYFAHESHPVPLSVTPHPEKVRVFVDYEKGRVSFYDVDTAAVLHSFTGCNFTEKLYPFFSPGRRDGGKNSAPLIISALNSWTGETTKTSGS